MELTLWNCFKALVALLGSLVLTNAIVLWMKKKQYERVQLKSAQLAQGATTPSTPVTVVTGARPAAVVLLLAHHAI